MRSVIITVLFGIFLQAETLDTLIDAALSQNRSLKAIEHRLNMVDLDISLSTQFSNPEIALKVNDIQFNDVSDRSIERMQYESINVKQKLPYFGQRDAAKTIAQAHKKVVFNTLQEAKSQLVSQVKKEAYAIWELRELYAINSDFEELAQQNLELNQAYTITSDNRHMGIMSTQLTLSELKIEKNAITQKLQQRYARLSYLVGNKVEHFDIALSINEMPELELLKESLEGNYRVKASEKALLREKNREKLRELKEYPDTTVQAGYYHREAFEDYASIQVAFTLPIYGTESQETQKARIETFARQEEFQDKKIEVQSQLQSTYAKMMDAYTTYAIIDEESVPQIEHMFDLSSASVRSGGDLFKYIELLKQKLSLEIQKIKAIAQFNAARADIAALTGVIQ